MKNEFNLDIWKINKYFEETIKKNIKEIAFLYMSDFEIKELALKIDRSTTIEIIKDSNLLSIRFQNDNTDSNNIINNYQLNNSSFFEQNNNPLLNNNQSLSSSTLYDSKINANVNVNINNSIIELCPPIYQLNSIRSNFYLKNNLNDILFFDEMNAFDNNSDYLPKYKINNELFVFMYPNDLITYRFTIVAFLANNQMINNDSKDNLEVNDSKYYSLLGLYFCGKSEEIKIENKVNIKKCLPNEFICKKCMLINKRKYNLKSTYLININGRVTRMNKGAHHCFGHFLSGSQIEDCISKFTCKACKMINYYLKYYSN